MEKERSMRDDIARELVEAEKRMKKPKVSVRKMSFEDDTITIEVDQELGNAIVNARRTAQKGQGLVLESGLCIVMVLLTNPHFDKPLAITYVADVRSDFGTYRTYLRECTGKPLITHETMLEGGTSGLYIAETCSLVCVSRKNGIGGPTLHVRGEGGDAWVLEMYDRAKDWFGRLSITSKGVSTPLQITHNHPTLSWHKTQQQNREDLELIQANNPSESPWMVKARLDNYEREKQRILDRYVAIDPVDMRSDAEKALDYLFESLTPDLDTLAGNILRKHTVKPSNFTHSKWEI